MRAQKNILCFVMKFICRKSSASRRRRCGDGKVFFCIVLSYEIIWEIRFTKGKNT